MSSLGSSGGGSLLQVPGALPAISHASLRSGRSSRPMICLSATQSIDKYSQHRRSPADSVDGHRLSPAHRINRHRLSSAHSIDGCKFSPAHRKNRHRLSSAHSMDGYRPNQEHNTDRPKLMSSHSIDRHPSLRLSPPHSAISRPSRWLSPEDSLDRNKLSPSYVPDSSVMRRPASFCSASRQLRRQVGYYLLSCSFLSFFIGLRLVSTSLLQFLFSCLFFSLLQPFIHFISLHYEQLFADFWSLCNSSQLPPESSQTALALWHMLVMINSELP